MEERIKICSLDLVLFISIFIKIPFKEDDETILFEVKREGTASISKMLALQRYFHFFLLFIINIVVLVRVFKCIKTSCFQSVQTKKNRVYRV
jgi:nicotinamide riboside transporter PnuC